ncbi:MAG: ParB/RepB/Spo0J family partition protein [Planctomycetaceae bacterium]|jgi:ParB family chromosome partitioning protein|nr:ParB/RepB/Spo0J family partition protein [Planctomycetaceae bacterium]
MAKEKRLGRGLEALLGRIGGYNEDPAENILQEHSAEIIPPISAAESAKDYSGTVDILKIVPNPYQPRLDFDETEIEQLAQSIAANGLLQAIAVRPKDGLYQIIAGERRFRAAIRAGWDSVPVRFLEDVDDRQMLELALTENLQRKDLNAIEKAASFANYLKLYGGTHEELAKRLELDRSTVTNLLRLLELPQELQDAVRKEHLTTGHVRALLPLEKHEQIEIASKIQNEGWSVRQTEKFVQNLIKTGEAVSPKDADWKVISPEGEERNVSKKSEHLVRLEQDFRNKLGGVKVQLTQTNEKGKGKLVIVFASHQEFEQIYAAICKTHTVMPNKTTG